MSDARRALIERVSDVDDAIRMFYNRFGCLPSVRWIRKRTGRSHGWIVSALLDLEAAGRITRYRDGGRVVPHVGSWMSSDDLDALDAARMLARAEAEADAVSALWVD